MIGYGMSEGRATKTTTVNVRYSTGAYVTSTVLGKRASSTMSAEAAVARLAEKVFGGDGTTVHLVQDAECGRPQTWRIEHVEAR